MRLHISYNRFPLRFAVLAMLLLLPALFAAANSPLSLPQDSDGWTVFTPSSDTRIMYVSSSQGNDSTGQVYNRNDVSDPFNPANVNAFRTFDAAFNHARSGRPDWVLLRRGDEFSTNMTPHSGRGPTEFSLIGAYGSGGAMPLVHPGSGSAVSIANGLQYSAIVGIDFYARRRDPDSPYFESTSGGAGFWGVTYNSRVTEQLLIEGSRFRFFSGNGFNLAPPGELRDIAIRRTVITDNYAPDGGGHAQGIYVGRVDGLLLEENVFDHNGWYSQAPGEPGPATVYNHNTYFANTHNVTFRDNVFLRPSSIHNKFTANDGSGSSTDITLTGNLYIDGEIGVSMGGNQYGARRFTDITIRNNLFTEIGRSRPTNRRLAWTVDIIEWDRGVVSGNYFLHYNNPDSHDVYAIGLRDENHDVRIDRNVIYNLNPHGNSDRGKGVFVQQFRNTSPASSSNIVVENNSIHELENALRLVEIESSSYVEPLTIRENAYYSAIGSNSFWIDGSGMSFGDWRESTGDQSEYAEPEHPDPTRSIETYMAHLGETPNIDAFIHAARSQGRFSWDYRYTASEVNRWMKSGFAGSTSEPTPATPESPTGIRVID